MDVFGVPAHHGNPKRPLYYSHLLWYKPLDILDLSTRFPFAEMLFMPPVYPRRKYT